MTSWSEDSDPMRIMSLLHESLRAGLRGLVADAERMETDSYAASRLSEGVSLLHAVYREHSDAEDEVIFPAISARVANVVDGYAMEHEHEDRLFFELEQSLQTFDGTDIRCKAHALQSKVLLHLDKEERQLFPLLRRNFSPSEQASLLWAFTCQLPVRLGGRVLRWVHSVLPSHIGREFERLLDSIAPGTHQRRIIQAWLCPGRARGMPLGKRSRSSTEVSDTIAQQKDEDPMSLLYSLEQALWKELELWVAEAKLIIDDASEPTIYATASEKDDAAEVARLAARRRLLWKAAGAAKSAAARLAGREASDDDIFSAHEQPIRQGMNMGDLKAGLDQVEKAISEGWPSMRLDRLSKNEVGDSEKTLKAVAFAMPLSALERLLQRMERNAATALLARLRKACQAEEVPLLDLLEEEVAGRFSNSDKSATATSSTSWKAMRLDDATSTRSTGQSPAVKEDSDSVSSEPPKRNVRQPIDHIFQFHSAFKQELRTLENEARALDSSNIFEDEHGKLAAAVRHFDGRFCFLWGVYSAHSKSEDDFVFPALESKQALSNVSQAYTLDHEAEENLFRSMDERLSRLRRGNVRSNNEKAKAAVRELQELASSIRRSVDTHVEQEEQHLWPLFQRFFSQEEQCKIVGDIIGCTGAEALRATLQWVSRGLSNEQMSSMLDSMREASGNTSFSEWLDNWWPLPQRVQREEIQHWQHGAKDSSANELQPVEQRENTRYPFHAMHKAFEYDGSADTKGAQVATPKVSGIDTKRSLNSVFGGRESKHAWQPGWQEIFRMVQTHLEESVQSRSSQETGTAEKAYLLQSLAAARWATAQQERLENARAAGQSPAFACEGQPAKSYKDESSGLLGCRHYARCCRLVAHCCGREYVCRFCHDAVETHNMDRRATEVMVCMLCNMKQAVAGTCAGCGASMADYFCKTCKFFENEGGSKPTYHCQFCNLCRRGKGLGVDMAHCMQCNTCMTKADMANHTCLEGGIESDCPICGEFLFTSGSPFKQMVCGHYMHSDCFQAHTRSRYTCPVCRKSLGDMSAYFRMLDELVASQPMPVELQKKQTPIFCNDCEQRSNVAFHFAYLKCAACGSYNTTLR